MAREWNVEEQILKNSKYTSGIRRYSFNEYPWEYEFSTEDKIEFIDKYASPSGLASYLINLADCLKAERDKMPLDNWGSIKTVSLKAWIRRNDSKGILDNSWHYGHIVTKYLDRYIQAIDSKGNYDKYENFIDQMFYKLLSELCLKEEQWFAAHDEYSILLNEIKEESRKHGCLVPIITGSKTQLSDGSDNFVGRDFTLAELKELKAKYNELEQYIEKLKKSISFSFDNPATDK
jgi:hypothetical protein